MSLTHQWPLVKSNRTQSSIEPGAADASNEKATNSHEGALQSHSLLEYISQLLQQKDRLNSRYKTPSSELSCRWDKELTTLYLTA